MRSRARLSSAFRATMPMDEVTRGLRELEGRFTEDVLAQALETAMEPIASAAQANLEQVATGPYSTGRTARAGVLTRILDRGAVVAIGLWRKGKSARAYVGYWLEYGIPSRGIAARPWMRPAQDAGLPGVPRRFAAALGRLVGLA